MLYSVKIFIVCVMVCKSVLFRKGFLSVLEKKDNLRCHN